MLAVLADILFSFLRVLPQARPGGGGAKVVHAPYIQDLAGKGWSWGLYTVDGRLDVLTHTIG